MRRKILTTAIALFLLQHLQGQIINGPDTLYGNEWINFDQSYFKIMVAEDGMYRIPWQTLSDAGLPLNQVNGNQFQLFRNGEQVPLYLTTDGLLGNSDYLEFFGKKNTSELDRHLFKDPGNEMINPLYSLITDTAAYFLTWTNGVPLRYQPLPNDLTNLPPKEEYYTGEHVLNYFSAFSKKANAQGVSSSDYGMTEGWSNAFANVQTITVNPANVYAGSPNGQLYLRYGSNIGQHQQLITLNDQPLLTDEFSDFQVRQLQFDIPNATLAAPMTLKLQGLAASTDRSRIANVILRYPATFNFSNQPYFAFELPASSVTRYLEISNFNAAGGTPVLYDLTNRTRLTAAFENDLVKIALPASANPVRLVLVNSNTGVKTVSTLKEVQFIDYTALDAEFIFLSNPRLYDDGTGVNWVQEYANYRSSAAGGGYSTIIVDVQQLYDQFGWGINRHPLGVRNFGHFVRKYWEDVQYMFIIGKGREYPSIRTSAQLVAATNFYVPTFGSPGADNLLLSTNETATPVLGVGRIPVTSPQLIQTFLQKLKDYESNTNLGQSIEERAWMKNVLHLGGGGNAGEQSIIKNYLQSMQQIIETGKFAGKVSSLYKSSTDPIQMSQADEVFKTINAGTSIITVFGHASVGSFDFNLDNPSNYDNYKKYPMLFSLGCYSGNIHTGSQGIGERFIFQESKGAMGFAATSGQAYISSLQNFMSKWYELMGSSQYGESIGKITQAAISQFDSGNGLNGLTQQFTYAGDPAMKINHFSGSDFVPDRSSVSFDPAVVNAQMEKFSIRFNMLNLGKNTQDSLFVEVIHELPGGQRRTAAKEKIAPNGFATALQFEIPITGKEFAGLNKFYIKVDADENIEELPAPAAELNNELGTPVSFFILDNSATPVYPPAFAIVGQQGIELKASTTNPLAPIRKYVMELDTTATFNSTWKKVTEISQSGGVIKWKPNVQYADSTVYYWRISPAPGPEVPDYVWSGSSFVYIQGSPPGWNQSHYYQLLMRITG